MKLYDYWRSSASYRLRIALELKGATYEVEQVNIAPGSDEQFREGYRILNPQMRVPALEVNGQIANQSMAIIEWIEETIAGPSLLPEDAWTRLEARAFADTIACDVHPLNNLSVLAALRQDFGADDDAIKRWYHEWIKRGFVVLETLAQARPASAFLFGDAPTIAEIALIPQVYNARRYDMDLSAYPRLIEIDATCNTLAAFQRAVPTKP